MSQANNINPVACRAPRRGAGAAGADAGWLVRAAVARPERAAGAGNHGGLGRAAGGAEGADPAGRALWQGAGTARAGPRPPRLANVFR